MPHPYEDILHRQRPEPAGRAPLSMHDRAAQFSPFAALSGYGEAIAETGRLTQERPELSPEEQAVLDRKQSFLLERLSHQPPVTIAYFLPDDRKSGGSLCSVSGVLRRVDEEEHCLLLEGDIRIPLGDVLDIQSPLLPEML